MRRRRPLTPPSPATERSRMVVDRVGALIDRLRVQRWANLVVVNLRIAIGFAFVPAGLKKLLGQPFTDSGKRGPFHDFLDAFLATGGFYRFVGVLQLVAAVLLMTQRYATVGAALALPIATAIAAFCWSTTAGIPTIAVTSLMAAGLAGLLVWDLHAWRSVFEERAPAPRSPGAMPIDRRVWAWCGVAVLATYVGLCVVLGEVYRPRRPTPDSPAYYVLPAIALMPAAAWAIERRRRRRDARSTMPT
jgi:uncharacterized membrane protein YphA (DoxX/SURF4 family)